MNHDDLCPAGRDSHHLCICETLRLVRAAKRSEEREKERKEEVKPT